MGASAKARYRLEIAAVADQKIDKIGPATVLVLDADGCTVASDKGDLSRLKIRKSVARSLAEQLGEEDSEKWLDVLSAEWAKLLDKKRAAANGVGNAVVGSVEMLDEEPRLLRRPLSLIDGISYAATWPTIRTTDDEGQTVSEKTLLIVRGDGTLFADAKIPGRKPLESLGVDVRLPHIPPPESCWSGAGAKRYLGGERADPASVFERCASVVNRFVDFDRSLADQRTMAEMTVCYVVASYLTEGMNAVGYLWPNGDKGTGKSTFLTVVTELGYLGSLILAGSSYPCLRDFADYGAVLAFDDAETVMDTRKTDPDKRTLLLAGSRRGASIAVKELSSDGKTWQTRYVDCFCPRLFSAIKLPDPTLGSRSIVVPLIRSSDARRAKANPENKADWPTDRRRLIDDLWATGLEHLPSIPRFDELAASRSELCGRTLDPWRGILAVALWLQEEHGIRGLYDRMAQLSVGYQTERIGIEENDRVRVLFRALLRLTEGHEPEQRVELFPKNIAAEMNQLAEQDSLGGSSDHPFARPDTVGRMLRAQRFDQAARQGRGRPWIVTRQEVVRRACAFGVVPETPVEPATDNEASF
jgi:hypothetical protein